MFSDPLVPSRGCGDCTVCCVVPAIDHEEIQKHAGVRCPHAGQGCAIYETRPTPCREFFCAWRFIAGLGDEWRPDRSGILLWPDTREENGKKVPTVTVTLLRNEQANLASLPLIKFIAANILEGRSLYLAKPGSPGLRPLRVQLNSPQMLAAAQRGPGPVRSILEQAWAFLGTQTPRPYGFSHTGHLME